MILQLSPTIPLETPKGKGWAHFIFEHGDEHHIQWFVAIDETGEWWVFQNPDVRIQQNWTMGRRNPTTLPTPALHRGGQCGNFMNDGGGETCLRCGYSRMNHFPARWEPTNANS